MRTRLFVNAFSPIFTILDNILLQCGLRTELDQILYLLLMQIDDEVAATVEKIGFDRKWLIECLQRREQTKVLFLTLTRL